MAGIPYVGPDATLPNELVTLGQADARYQAKTGDGKYWNVSNIANTNAPSFTTSTSGDLPSGVFTYLGTEASGLVDVQGTTAHGARWKLGGATAYAIAPWAIKFHVSKSRYVEFLLAPTSSTATASIRLSVDGVEASIIPMTFPAWPLNVFSTVRIDLGPEPRPNNPVIRIDMSENMLLSKVWVENGGVITPAAKRGRRYLFHGDSLTEGETQNTGGSLGSYVGYMPKLLNVDDVWNSGIRGSGPNTAGGLPALNYKDRINTDVVPARPDYLIINGWYNDRAAGRTAAQIAADIDEIIRRARTMIPTYTKIVVIGSPDPTGTSDASFIAIDTAVRAVCAAANIWYISATTGQIWDAVGALAASQSPWITTANKTWVIGSDNLHPTDLGHQYMATRVYESIALAFGLMDGETALIRKIEDQLGTTNKRLPRRLRRMSYGAGSQANTVSASVTITQRGLRIPVELPCDTTRWRMRAWNFDPFARTTKANLTGKSMVIGDAARDTLGMVNGNFVGNAAVSLVSGDYTIPGTIPTNWYTDGVYTSPWFTDDVQQFKANTTRVIGTGVTLAASTSVQTSEQQGMFFATATDGADPTKTGPANGWIPFTMVIEYETVTDRMCVLVVGDSIPTGITGTKGAAQTAHVPIPTYRNYPNQWAKNNNALVQQIGFSGGSAANYNTSGADSVGLYGRYDLASPDFDLIIFAIGSNDASISRSLANYQADCQSIWAKINSYLRPNIPLWIVNITPRAFGTTPESIRQAYNEWWAQGPLGIAGVIDMDGAMTTGASTGALKASLSMDGVHFSWVGQIRAATELEKIPTRRS